MTPGELTDRRNALANDPEYLALRERREALKVKLQQICMGEAPADEYTPGREADMRRQMARVQDQLQDFLEAGMRTVLTCQS
jgi:hypothetical protein